MLFAPLWKTLLYASGLALLPAPLDETEDALALGNEHSWLPARGGSGGSPQSLKCPATQVAVGVYGRVATSVNSLGLLCRTLNAEGSLGASSATAMAGSTQGRAFSIQCPDGQAVVGFRGHSGELLEALGLHCAAPDAWMHSAQVQGSVDPVGSHSGDAFSDVCSQESVITELYVRTGHNVDRQQATCTRMRSTPAASDRGLKKIGRAHV